MARINKKGEKGAAKAYMTRTAAVKKLQCSLADFRRLCILKGIFPREPRHRKKANKGSSAPTSFYYTKDIIYLAHEPVLGKLREHKAFAKKLARALGRGEWSSAKSLEENNKPVYTLDHVIKERYPTFIDALRDIDDALCLVTLFASLPSNPRVPPTLIDSCYRLSSQWQLYVMHTRSLRKVFLSIKGVYYQAEVMGETITWLVPYQFTQTIPTDVDVRVMLTFLELYQTLLGFVFYKLYTDAGLVYPPPIDAKKDDEAAGVGAFSLVEAEAQLAQDTATRQAQNGSAKVVDAEGKPVKGKDVRKTIKEVASIPLPEQEQSRPLPTSAKTTAVEDAPEEEFVPQPSTSNTTSDALPTLHTLSILPSAPTKLFASYNIFLSLGTPRSLLEFIIRSFGGRVGWPASVGSGSPFTEEDDCITHVIVDRPLPPTSSLSEAEMERRRKRKYVQPQWVVDCVNFGKVLLEEPYGQGKTLPPHLSPFGEGEGAYIPQVSEPGAVIEDEDAAEDEMISDDEEEEEQEEQTEGMDEDSEDNDVPKVPAIEVGKALKAAAEKPSDPALRRAAELEAERAGLNAGEFEEGLRKAVKRAEKMGKLDATKSSQGRKEKEAASTELEMNKMLMSNKKRNLYNRMKYGERKKAHERTVLEQKRDLIKKEKRKEIRRSLQGSC